MLDRRLSNSLAIRLDVAFNKFNDRTLSESPTFREVGTNLLIGSVSAEVFSGGGAAASDRERALHPYLVAGFGAYRFRFDHVCRGPECVGPERVGTSRTNLGFNVGAGSTVSVIRWMPFFQVGYHITVPKSGNTRLLLASLGLRFR